MLGFSSIRRKRGRSGALRVLGSERAATIEPGETLLSAAARANIPFPRMCNVGERGTCKCRPTKGHVRLKKDSYRHVTPEELPGGAFTDWLFAADHVHHDKFLDRGSIALATSAGARARTRRAEGEASCSEML
ncbi:2Fe-2S iron-sulfur cluster binding domain-containing protein [Sorangium sp. So ce119]|uniref:2Fe-2S iron-sulfur cluster binding domain-containing protein n=1 Tax=Sorangium sp. So ce119 TaxID=3133279 RepID=UPI003F5ED20F